ncbi:NADAR family protein [Phototrophicus methaneseepsis]|uniref:NADAR family protein n=1 Tax=Phototrophicus methaneseepsis TaxID=2710758 RepID=A0A7S8E7W3_9CHLR|nr:NADAR family protein [Phototrophicus methaneseepsis]QPC81980.1 NADAR family protein [Phototrophicus methaneseepsis]
MTIYFYSALEDPYGCFSNFSKHSFEMDGVYYKTSEHYFQAMKFMGSEEDMDSVRRAPTPKMAASIGRDRSRPLRTDWEAVKDDIMRQGVLKKFETHADIRQLLLATGDEPIVENAPGDRYWGAGPDGTGKNMLGKILMETRALLRRE